MEKIREIRVTRPYLIERGDALLLARRGDLLTVGPPDARGSTDLARASELTRVSPREAFHMITARYAEVPSVDLEDTDA